MFIIIQMASYVKLKNPDLVIGRWSIVIIIVGINGSGYLFMVYRFWDKEKRKNAGCIV